MESKAKLMNELYTIHSINEESANKITAQLEILRDHEIFRGHFPENPILPGVCFIQILKEILTLIQGKDLILLQASSIKYLKFLNPEINSIINFEIEVKEIENGHFLCNASIYFESITFCRFKGEFAII